MYRYTGVSLQAYILSSLWATIGIYMYPYRVVSSPFPSSLLPLFQRESWCEAFHMEISIIQMQSFVHLHVNKTNFHMKTFTLGLTLKQRRKATRKSPIEGGKQQKTKQNKTPTHLPTHTHTPTHPLSHYQLVTTLPLDRWYSPSWTEAQQSCGKLFNS